MPAEKHEFETKWGEIHFHRFLKIFQLYFENTTDIKGGFKREQYLWIKGKENESKMDKEEKEIRRVLEETLTSDFLCEAHGTSIYIKVAEALELKGFTVRQQLALFDDPNATIETYGGYLLSAAEES